MLKHHHSVNMPHTTACVPSMSNGGSGKLRNSYSLNSTVPVIASSFNSGHPHLFNQHQNFVLNTLINSNTSTNTNTITAKSTHLNGPNSEAETCHTNSSNKNGRSASLPLKIMMNGGKNGSNHSKHNSAEKLIKSWNGDSSYFITKCLDHLTSKSPNCKNMHSTNSSDNLFLNYRYNQLSLSEHFLNLIQEENLEQSLSNLRNLANKNKLIKINFNLNNSNDESYLSNSSANAISSTKFTTNMPVQESKLSVEEDEMKQSSVSSTNHRYCEEEVDSVREKKTINEINNNDIINDCKAISNQEENDLKTSQQNEIEEADANNESVHLEKAVESKQDSSERDSESIDYAVRAVLLDLVEKSSKMSEDNISTGGVSSMSNNTMASSFETSSLNSSSGIYSMTSISSGDETAGLSGKEGESGIASSNQDWVNKTFYLFFVCEFSRHYFEINLN
jgi:hypothetical protein